MPLVLYTSARARLSKEVGLHLAMLLTVNFNPQFRTTETPWPDPNPTGPF